MAQSLEHRRSINLEKRPEVAKKTRVKKSYVSPLLLEYGSIAKLTQSGGATLTDILGPQMRPCL